MHVQDFSVIFNASVGNDNWQFTFEVSLETAVFQALMSGNKVTAIHCTEICQKAWAYKIS